MKIIITINIVISILFVVCYLYQLAYLVVPFVKKAKKHKVESKHRFAILIAARNEEKVIGNLIKSIQGQTYDNSYVTIFVIADNCTDDTARIARELGAVVYERFNTEKVGKGYALDFLLSKMEKDYKPFDGYFVFDADNVLDRHYIEEMNKTFSDGYEIITSYRNSKNYDSNWISAGYALWFLRESRYLNEPRMLLGTSCAVSGTGFMFSRKVLEKNGGWKFFLLTEDIEFTVKNVIEKEKVGYSSKAQLYDEQPVTFAQSWKQRLRWSKGYYQVFYNYGAKLFRGIFKGSFSCFDMMMTIMPALVFTIILFVLIFISIIVGNLSGVNVLYGFHAIWIFLRNTYLILLFIGLITTITEWKRIHASSRKKILYTFTFPIFILTYIPISVTALLKKVEWVPIEHTAAKSIDELNGEFEHH